MENETGKPKRAGDHTVPWSFGTMTVSVTASQRIGES